MARKKVSLAAAAAAEFDAQLAAEAAPNGGMASEPTQEPAPAPVAVAPAAVAPAAPAAPAEPAVDWRSRAEAAQAEAERYRAAVSQREAELMAEREAERAEVQRQIEAARAEAQAAKKLAEEREEEFRRQEREKLLTANFDNLEHISPDAARELHEKVYNPVLTRQQAEYEARLKALRDELDTRTQKYEQSFTKIDEDKALAARARTNRNILAKHADFESLVKTAAFQEFESQRIPGSRSTWAAEIRAAYAENDAAHVIEILDTFKSRGGAPSLAAVAGLPSGGGATVATTPAAQSTKYSYSDLDTWKSQLRRGDITHKQFKELTASFKAAEAEGLVG